MSDLNDTVTRRAWMGGVSGVAASAIAGCAGTGVVLIGGKRVDAATIDRDPIALLPQGIVLFGNLDLAALFQTPIGGDVAALVSAVVPLGPESNFNAVRDASRVVGGLYAIQGVDFCVAIQGRFDRAAIQRSADARLAAPSGAAVVKTRYGEYDLYTVGNVGFVLLTDATMLSGNETGMRRALDRLRYGKLERSIPSWMVTVAETKDARFALAGDFGADSVIVPTATGEAKAAPRASSSPATPVFDAAAKNFPFLADLRALRVLGNFQPPGLNFAGSLTYASVDKAKSGAESLKNLSQMAQFASLLTSFGLGSSLPPIQLAISEADVGFVQPVDLGVARTVIGLMAGAIKR